MRPSIGYPSDYRCFRGGPFEIAIHLHRFVAICKECGNELDENWHSCPFCPSNAMSNSNSRSIAALFVVLICMVIIIGPFEEDIWGNDTSLWSLATKTCYGGDGIDPLITEYCIDRTMQAATKLGIIILANLICLFFILKKPKENDRQP